MAKAPVKKTVSKAKTKAVSKAKTATASKVASKTASETKTKAVSKTASKAASTAGKKSPSTTSNAVSKKSGSLIKVTLTKSLIGRLKSHKACVAGLGLRRIRHTVSVQDTPCNRGMINKVSYMLRVEEG